MSRCYRNQFCAIVLLLICDICTVFVPVFCDAANSITKGQVLKDGETLVSNELRFEMGFFGEEESSLRYVGIWYKDIAPPTYIWVANREVPLTDTAGLVSIGSDGNLVILDGANRSVWSSNVTTGSFTNSTAVLNDTGNLILFGGDDTPNLYWQSFDHPGDTYLPSMKISVNATMGENFCFISWRSPTDPSPGNYVMGIDPRAAPQIVIWERGNRRWRSGYWDGRIFTGVANMTGNYLYGFQIYNDGDDRYLSYSLWNKSDKFRFQITWDGYEKELRWNDTKNRWEQFQLEPAGHCDFYNKCGNFGICSGSGDSLCSCLKGFEPVYVDQWKKGNWSGGCRRRTPLKSERNGSAANKEDDGFIVVKNTKLPDFANLMEVGQTNTEVCEDVCLQNDFCTASAVVNGIGCMIWHGDLHDIGVFDTSGNSLSVRLAASDLDNKVKISVVIIIIVVMAGLIFCGVSIWLIWRFKFKLKVLPSASCYDGEVPIPIFQMTEGRETSKEFSASVGTSREGDQEYGPELPLFNFNCVALATDNFSEANKLGQGGFGPVYKGMLPGGQEIAVKRLSRKSSQGSEEFKNEVILLAKLQHRNLVRLLGCCIQEEEKMLLYEYLPNKSLDCFIFDPVKKTILDWKKRFDIIEGIARGLLYLQRDSRLRIIHRDLKASNILLDEEMNPKISDFGMARIFGGNQNEANTNRVVGTYGYMSPEYAMEGLFSVKSDVYSFGVLLLEILSGRKNTSFRLSENSSLVEYAWDLWSEGKAMELVDPLISASCCTSEVLRCIHVGMLCVQDSANWRPTMGSVVLMLESEATTLPMPRQPIANSMRRSREREFFLESQETARSNDLTVTMLMGR